MAATIHVLAFDNGHGKFNLWNKRIVKLYLNLMAYYHDTYYMKKCKLFLKITIMNIFKTEWWEKKCKK